MKIHSFPNAEYYLEYDVTTLVIISLPKIGIDCIALVHLYKEGNIESCSAL